MISDERILELVGELGLSIRMYYDTNGSTPGEFIRFARALLKEAGLTGAEVPVAEEPARQQTIPGIPPSDWDEWALRRSKTLVAEMETVNHPRAMLVARIHCLLIDAMHYANPQVQK